MDDDAQPVSTEAPDTTTSATTTPASEPSTTVPPTTTEPPPPPTYPLAVSVAFMDACVTDAEEAARCACAVSAFARSIPADELDSLASGLVDVDADLADIVPPALVASIAGCDGAVDDAPPTALLEQLQADCSLGDDRLTDACRCAVERAAVIVSADELADYPRRHDVSPSLVDLVNRCLA